MKRVVFLTFILTGFLITGKSQQINGIKIGNQVWTISNIDTEVKGSYYYNENPQFAKKYGKLYTYEAATKACPAGWRLPTIKDWSDLLLFMGGEDKAAPKMLKNTSEGGFNAKLGGVSSVGNYNLLESYGAYWSASEQDKDNAWFIYITPKSAIVTSTYSLKTHGLSVRCVKS